MKFLQAQRQTLITQRMDFAQLLLHLVYFFIPAFAMATVCVMGGAFLFGSASRWQRRWIWNAVTGSLVLLGGLVLFDNDGKMATYAALVLVSATMEWVWQRGWRKR